MSIRNKIIIIISIISFIISGAFQQVQAKENKEALFSYKKIIYDEFTIKTGSVIPLTISKSIETDGSITDDGNYLFYSSDIGGNFDIYLRSLTDITTIRITGHAAKDTSPAFSPGGKYLAFVSQRDDPEGDVFVIEINPKKLLAGAKEQSALPEFDAKARNLTTAIDAAGRTAIIKDASPCWSPDGELIAFSSARSGLENIWLMDMKGKNLTQVTRNGGMYPRFSNDGKKIVFVSYRDNKSGDIYIAEIGSRSETRITNSSGIKLYPAFAGSDREIIYTLIDRDTNNDRRISLNDNSVIYYKNLNSRLEYRLTLYSESSFQAVWSPAYNGVIIYSGQAGENINVNIIPEYGIIPKLKNVRLQFDLAEKYLKEYDDIELYLLCLERIFLFFKGKGDVESGIYISRALNEAGKYYLGVQDNKEAGRIQSLLAGMSKKESDYSSITGRYLNELLNGRPGAGIIKEAVSELRESSAGASDDKGKSIAPFLIEDLGDEYLRIKDPDNAVKAYTEIINEFPGYERKIYIHYKLARLTYKYLQEYLSPSYLEVLASANLYLQIDAAKDIIRIFEAEKNLNKRIAAAKRMLEMHNNTKSLPELLLYIIGKAYFQKGDPASAKSSLLEGLKLSKKSTYMYYKINIHLGQIAESEKNYSDIERYLAEGANWFERRYKETEHRNILQRVINYYEEFGERAESTGDYSKAVELYKAYVSLLSHLHTRKIFTDIYNEYAPKAYVLYIDAYSEWKRNDYNELSKLEYEFNEKENILNQRRLSLDKAHIYGLAYIYTKKACIVRESVSGINISKDQLDTVLSDFNKAVNQIGWALFMDDNFIDCELLKGWIYQYVDLLRQMDEESGGKKSSLFDKYFPDHLWEKNIPSYEKALAINNERDYPGREGNLHLNLANTYFLLSNYPRALVHYIEAGKFKKNFGSKIEEALFYYHLGYCHWQNDEIAKAKEEMSKTLRIYEMLAAGNIGKYKYQIYYLYRFFALFDRTEKKYDKAISSFNRVIEFSDKHKIKIDRARYLQEIAYCHKELGDMETALLYLNKAGQLLSKYKTTERDYNLKINMLGLFSFSIWNLGEESFIIGSSRIYTELDTAQKRILNASLEEEIFSEKGDYKNAIEAAKKKLALLKDAGEEKYRETENKILNNIGYYYFTLKDYVKAGDNFRQAMNSALKSGDNNLEGLFVTVLNTVNLYSFMLENRISGIEDPLKTIDSFIKQIAAFRESYREKRYNEELKKMKESAKAQSRKISAGELNELEIRISRDAGEKYYRLEIAAAELEFQKAELLREGSGISAPVTKNAALKGYNIYAYNKTIHDLYSAASGRFESALERAEKDASKRLLVKLLLNHGKCKERKGDFADSYYIYLNALKYASANAYDDLLWIVYRTIADFLVENGMHVQDAVEGDFLLEAQKYYKNATDIVEEIPYLYRVESSRIKSLYNNYSGLLVNLKNPEKSLEISERGYEILRIISTGLIFPKFYSDSDNSAYREFIKQIKEIETVKAGISLLLETGEPADSVKLTAAKDDLKSRTSAFKNYIAGIKRAKPLFASFISMTQDTLPKYDNAVVFKFMNAGRGLCAWKIDSGNIFFKEFLYNTDHNDQIDHNNSLSLSINDFMQAGSAGKHRFVIMNDISVKMFRDTIQNTIVSFPLFMFVPSVERAGYYTSANNISINKSSVVIDGKAEPSVFFQKRMEPGLLIIKPEQNDPDFINQITEASLYSGVRTLFVCDYKTLPRNILELITEDSMGPSEPFNVIARKNRNILGIGFQGYIRDEREKIKFDFINRGYVDYQKSLENGDIENAELHLNKWHEINPGSEVYAKYFLNMAEIGYLRGNYPISLSYIDKAIASGNNSPDIFVKAVSNKIFLLLLTGDLPSAEAMMQGNPLHMDFIKTADYAIYKSILALLRSGTVPSVIAYTEIIRGKSILPKNKLKLLFAEFLNIYGSDLMNIVLEGWEIDFIAGERDILKAAVLNKKAGSTVALTQRVKDILSLDSYKGSTEVFKNNVQLQIAKLEKTDNISLYQVYFAAKYLLRNSRSDIAADILLEANIAGTAENAVWIDAFSLFVMASGLFEAEGRYDDALNVVKEINDLLKTRGILTLLKTFKYKEAVFLSKLDRNNESYNSALNGISLVKDNEELYINYQLQLANEGLYLGKIEDAKSRIAIIERNMEAAKNNKYIVDMLKARIELLDIIKKKQASDAEWKSVERLILTALETIDSRADTISLYNNINLINDSLDFIISYKMSRNDAEGSLLYAEIKKLINIRARYYKLISSFAKQAPGDVIRRYKDINDKRESSEFINYLNKYPSLLVNAFPLVLPVEIFQQKLEKNTIVFYLVTNAKDILGWIISKDSIKTVRLKNGNEKINDIIIKYYDDLSSLKNTTGISKELYVLFKPIEKYYKDKTDIIIITDKALERIPFEIIGERTMLEETHDIAYLTSIFSSLITYRQSERAVRFIDKSSNKLINELEAVAVRESGIPFGFSAKTESGIAHINTEILFDSFNSLIYISNELYHNIINRYRTVYIPDYKMHNLGFNEFTFINSLTGVKEVIINNAGIHDINNALFVDNLYNKINKREGVINSFHRAKESLRKNREYSYPAYWAGIRLYLNGI